MLTPFQAHVRICHKCKHSKTQQGGCAGPCPCDVDGKDIVEHAEGRYCPAGKYPFAGLGSVITWFIWNLRIPFTSINIPTILRFLRLFDPAKCKCAERQSRLNEFWKRLFGKVSP